MHTTPPAPKPKTQHTHTHTHTHTYTHTHNTQYAIRNTQPSHLAVRLPGVVVAVAHEVVKVNLAEHVRGGGHVDDADRPCGRGERGGGGGGGGGGGQAGRGAGQSGVLTPGSQVWGEALRHWGLAMTLMREEAVREHQAVVVPCILPAPPCRPGPVPSALSCLPPAQALHDPSLKPVYKLKTQNSKAKTQN